MVCPSLWRDPAGQRSPSMTAKMDLVVSLTLLRSLVEKHTVFMLTPPLMYLCLSYIVASSFPGDYEISVKFNDQHIPDSPYLVPVVAPVNDARRLTVTGLQVRHEETPPHSPVLLKGSGAQLHKNMLKDRFYFHTEQIEDMRVRLVWVFILTHNF